MNAEQWSLRVTLDTEARADLDTLRNLLSHKIPDGDLSAVVKEALRCAVEKHARRKGAGRSVSHPACPEAAGAPVAPEPASSRGTAPERPPPAPDVEPIPLLATPHRFDPLTVTAEVRREVWERDGARCSYVAPDGRRCDSQWQLELDHIAPEARGGPPTVANLRLRCRPHNQWAAIIAYGREHMAQFLPSLAPAPEQADERVRPRGPNFTKVRS